MTKHFDYCILGAGLAGISLAHELSKDNATVCLIDPNGIASGASGTPLGLVNPATGRYATLTWKAVECYSAVLENLHQVQKESPVQFFKKTGVLRPALDRKIASRMKENFDSTEWPAGWAEWLDEKEIKDFHKGINCVGGGIWLPEGLTVDISCFLNEFVRILTLNNVKTYFGKNYSISKKEENWEISLSNQEKFLAEKIVFTTGSSNNELDFWKDIPLHPIKGQLVVLEASSSLSFQHAVSALGYIASLSTRKFVIGSTYEHNFEDETINVKGLEYLLTRFEKVLPDLRKNSNVISQWAGIRASTPNRMPILGKHPNKENLYIFAGLSSKGLLYSAYLSRKIKDYLLFDEPLPAEVDISRFK